MCPGMIHRMIFPREKLPSYLTVVAERAVACGSMIFLFRDRMYGIIYFTRDRSHIHSSSSRSDCYLRKHLHKAVQHFQFLWIVYELGCNYRFYQILAA